MRKKYNYYDTPHNHPETTKYRNWETSILIFGIGVVTTLLLLHHFFGGTTPTSALDQPNSYNDEIAINTSINDIPDCAPVNMIHAQERDRLIQLLALANDLPIEQVLVNEIGTVCYDVNHVPVYDVTTDIIVTVGYTPAAKLTDYDALGDHVSTILPSMMQIQPMKPNNIVIRFLVGDTYLEWSRSYHQTTLYTQSMQGEELWFWVEPEY